MRFLLLPAKEAASHRTNFNALNSEQKSQLLQVSKPTYLMATKEQSFVCSKAQSDWGKRGVAAVSQTVTITVAEGTPRSLNQNRFVCT